MSDLQPTAAAAPGKPAKPYPDYPLTPHPTGRWCKKIRGKLYYFGPLADPDAALAKYLDQKDALHAGRTPRPETGAATAKDAANAFLNHKHELLMAGEITARTFSDYKEACDLFVPCFGKGRLVDDLGPDDFAKLRGRMAARWGPLRLGNMIKHTRSAFKHAFDAGLIDRPVRFGPGFKRPAKKVLRLHRAAAGAKLFTAEEVRRLIEGAGAQVRAMILLGVNCGLGNNDVGRLRLDALDLDNAWLDYPRPKTGIARRCPLWPETVAALREALADRPHHRQGEAGGFVFVTIYGRPWLQESHTGPVAQVFGRLLRKLGVNGRKGLGFYTLRHTFRTVADEARDQPAADFIMGHESPHMSSHYRERISDERLRAVAGHVRHWLFGPSAP